LKDINKQTPSEIKRKAKMLGIVYSDAVHAHRPRYIFIRFLFVLNILELRDNVNSDEVEIYNDQSLRDYARTVKKSRRKPRKKRGKNDRASLQL